MTSVLHNRAERLRRQAGAGRDVLATRPEHIYWLTGHRPEPGYLGAILLTADEVHGIWPFAVPEGAPGESYDPWLEPEDRGGIEEAFRGLLARAECPVISDSILFPEPALDVFATAIRVKDAEAIAEIERGLGANEAAFRRVAAELEPGAGGLEICSWCSQALNEAGEAPVPFRGNIGVGAAGADPESLASPVRAERGDTVFTDLYPPRAGYQADSSRAYAVAEAADWAREGYAAIRSALDTAAELIEPGREVAEVDRACREAATVDGVTYPHHTGHGLGLFSQEPPYVVPKSRDVFQVGDVIAIEPGRYVEGVGGMRVEEVFYLEEGGLRTLSAAPRELQVCGG